MLKKLPFIKQSGTKECAAASVWMIVRYYGGMVPASKLSTMLKISKNGTTAYHIVNTLESLGFKAQGLKLTNIKKLQTPFIAHTIINKTYKHFIVVYEINKKYILIADPADKIKKITYDEFYSIFTGVVIIMRPVRPLPKEKNISPLCFYFNFLKKYRLKILKLGVLSLLVTTMSVISAFFFQTLIDHIASIKSIAIFFLFIMVINALVTYYRNHLLLKLTNKIEKDLLSKFFKQIISLPYLYYYGHTTGEIISKFNDLNLLKDLFAKSLVTIFFNFPLTLFSGIILFLSSKTLFIIIMSNLILYLLIVIIFHHKILASINNYQNNKAVLNSYMTECISGFETIKGLNIKNKIYQKFYFKQHEFLNSYLHLSKLSNLETLLKDFVGVVGQALTLIVGIILVQKNTLTLSQLITCISLTTLFLEPIRSTIDLDFEIEQSLSALKRVLDLVSTKKKKSNRPTGPITFNDVSYSFNDINPVLKNVNLKIKENNKILITGASGSGKSTLLKLIKGYLKGNVQIGGEKVKNANNIVLISSKESLFTESIYDNLTIKSSKDFNDIINICYISEIINTFDLGYNTLLEENGSNLSAGQRQRIILGRSLYNFDVLLIDEALNSLNSDLERKILKKLFTKYPNKTIIIVSHRLDNLDLFDQYIKLDKGKIILNETYNTKGVNNV